MSKQPMNPSSQQQELRDALRPFCDEILRQGAQLYKDGRLLGGRAEVDAELRKIMATIHSHMQAGFDYVTDITIEESNEWDNPQESGERMGACNALDEIRQRSINFLKGDVNRE